MPEVDNEYKSMAGFFYIPVMCAPGAAEVAAATSTQPTPTVTPSSSIASVGSSIPRDTNPSNPTLTNGQHSPTKPTDSSQAEATLTDNVIQAIRDAMTALEYFLKSVTNPLFGRTLFITSNDS